MSDRYKENIIRTVIILLMAVYAFMHPKIIFWILIALFGVFTLITTFSKEERSAEAMRAARYVSVACILIICAFNYFHPVFIRNDYKIDIASLKKDNIRSHEHFPDELPENATGISWFKMFNFIQNGNHDLCFYTDQAYLQQKHNAYAGRSVLYTYKEEDEEYPYSGLCHWNEKTEKYELAHKYYVIHKYSNGTDLKDCELLVIYDTGENNAGIMIDWKTGFICFWEY